MVLLSFLNVLLKAELMMYAVLHPRCARPISGLSRVLWAKLIALRFTLVASFLAKSVRLASAVVMLLSRNRLSLLYSCQSVRRNCCCRAILSCWRCCFGSNMMVLSSVSCETGLGVKAGAAHVVVGALETESMANAFLVVVKTGGFILCL